MSNKILLQINACRNYGSTGRINEQIGLLAEQNGWTSYIAHGSRYVNPSRLKSIQVVSKLEEYWHAIETKIFDNHGLSSRIATRRFIKKIKEINPTIVHLHTIHGYYINYKILFDYLSKANIPVVWTLHDCWNFTGHCAHFDFHGCEKWKSGCYECPLKKDYPGSFVLQNSKRNYLLKKFFFTSLSDLTLVPVSNWLANLVNESFFKDCPNIRIQTIYNGVDIDVFKPESFVVIKSLKERLGISEKKVLLGCAVPFGVKKGYGDFLELREKLDDSYAIVMVGVSQKQKEEVCSKGIIGISRTQNVQELVNYYSMSDLFINLTYSDTFPTTNLESLACGTPVLTYDTGGSVESVDERTGVVVKKGNMNVLVETIKLFTSKLKNSDACRKRAVSLYDKRDKYQEYIDLYESILKK